MCRADGCESPEVSRHTRPTARKEHQCDECRRTIRVGEVYRSIFSVWEGAPFTHKTCAHCQVATEWLAINCGGWIFEEVRAEIEEHAEEYPDLAEPLSAIAKNMWRCWKTEAGELLPIPSMPPAIPAIAEAEARRTH